MSQLHHKVRLFNLSSKRNNNGPNMKKKTVTLEIAFIWTKRPFIFISRYLHMCDMLNDFKAHSNILFHFIFFSLLLQGVKGAPYYVGSAQTLPRGMYSDRNKNIIGKCASTTYSSVAISHVVHIPYLVLPSWFKSFRKCIFNCNENTNRNLNPCIKCITHSNILMSACGKNFNSREKCCHSRHLIYVDSVFPYHLVFMGSSSSKVSIYFFYIWCIVFFMTKMEKYFRKKNCEWSGVVIVRNGSLKFCVFIYRCCCCTFLLMYDVFVVVVVVYIFLLFCFVCLFICLFGIW